MNIGIIVFPGTWSDRDCEFALSSFKNVKTFFIWHKESIPKNIDAVILPGGFSYGDHLRAGAIAQFSLVMKDVFQLNQKSFLKIISFLFIGFIFKIFDSISSLS